MYKTLCSNSLWGRGFLGSGLLRGSSLLGSGGLLGLTLGLANASGCSLLEDCWLFSCSWGGLSFID